MSGAGADPQLTITLPTSQWQLLLNAAQQALAPYQQLAQVLVTIQTQAAAQTQSQRPAMPAEDVEPYPPTQAQPQSANQSAAQGMAQGMAQQRASPPPRPRNPLDDQRAEQLSQRAQQQPVGTYAAALRAAEEQRTPPQFMHERAVPRIRPVDEAS